MLVDGLEYHAFPFQKIRFTVLRENSGALALFFERMVKDFIKYFCGFCNRSQILYIQFGSLPM